MLVETNFVHNQIIYLLEICITIQNRYIYVLHNSKFKHNTRNVVYMITTILFATNLLLNLSHLFLFQYINCFVQQHIF